MHLVLNNRLRSLPEAPVLELPKITPSGLIIGTTNVITLNSKYCTSLLRGWLQDLNTNISLGLTK